MSAAPSRRDATREALLQSAVRLTAERGVEGATLGDVAEATGLSKGALTHHFASKDELLRAVLSRCAFALVDRFAQGAVGASSPAAQLRGGAAALWSAFEGRAEEARVMGFLAAEALRDASLAGDVELAWHGLLDVIAQRVDAVWSASGLRARVSSTAVARALVAQCVSSLWLPPGEAGDGLAAWEALWGAWLTLG